MELVENQRPSPWVAADYAFAARQLGRWNGACATGSPLPPDTWLARQLYRTWWPETNPKQDFQFSLNQKHILGDSLKRYERLWAERRRFFSMLDNLPQVFSHFDSQRRNLFIRKGNNGQDELVLIDWAQCGLGPLGAEIYAVVGMSATLLEWPPTALNQLDAAIFGSYLHGLGEAGWSGDAEVVRLGYVAWIAAWLGVNFPSIAVSWCPPKSHARAIQQFGCAEEELYLQWLPLLSYALNCADEARLLMKKLGLI